MAIDYEYIDKKLNLEASNIVHNIIEKFSDSLSPEILSRLPKNLDKIIVVEKPTKEDIERFSQEAGITNPQQFSQDYVPSAHGGRAKNDGLIHIYPYAKTFGNLSDDEIVKTCVNDIITHEIFHYFIRPDMKQSNDPVTSLFSSFITEGLVQLYAEEYQQSLGLPLPKSNYGQNVLVAKDLILGLPKELRQNPSDLHRLIFHSSLEELLQKSKVGDELKEEFQKDCEMKSQISSLSFELAQQVGITNPDEVRGFVHHFEKQGSSAALTELAESLSKTNLDRQSQEQIKFKLKQLKNSSLENKTKLQQLYQTREQLKSEQLNLMSNNLEQSGTKRTLKTSGFINVFIPFITVLATMVIGILIANLVI